VKNVRVHDLNRQLRHKGKDVVIFDYKLAWNGFVYSTFGLSRFTSTILLYFHFLISGRIYSVSDLSV